MGLRIFFRRSAARADKRVPVIVRAEPEPMKPLLPEHLAELQEAWAELDHAAKGAGVTRFQACGRTGKSWEDDPVAVRALAAMLRDFRTDGGTPAAKPGADV
jgi:hypothetical protein